MPAIALNGQRRLGPALAIAIACIVAVGAAASLVFGQIGADWLRISLVAQVIVVAGLGTVLARQIAVLRRTQGSLVAANADLAGAQASLETSNRILRATQKELQRARQQLIDGIEGLSDGLALYDAEDRLVVCNSGYQKLFGLHPDLLKPGTPFGDILRAHVSAGRVVAAIGREEEWIAERLAQHRDPRGLFERNIDGHWYRFSDRPTSEGGTVTIFTQIDELKQREQRLRENQAILQSILDNIPVTVSITDRERRIVLLNRRLEDIYGVHLAEVVGRPVDEVRPRRYAGDSAVRDHFRVIETGEPILGREDDYPERRESWITSVVPINGQDGAVRYVLRTTFEVPQLAKANSELADYRAFLLEAERQARIASWQETREAGYRTVWSENVEAVIGHPGGQLTDDASYLAVVHPDDRERIGRLFDEANRGAHSCDAEYRVVRGDGRTIWVRGITRAEFDVAGDVVRYIGTVQDITEAKRAEQALRDNEALLKEAQRRARLAYWLWDPEARRYLLAAEAEAILGLPVGDLTTNEDFLPFLHEDDRAWVAEAYLGQTERLEPCVLEYRWRRPDGRVIWLRDMCEQERDADGQVRRLVGTIQDVTEQKRAEEALRENQALLLAAQRRARIAYWIEGAGVGRGYTTSDFMAEVLGVPAGAVPISDGDYVKLVHPDDRAMVAHAYERAMGAHTPYAIEYRFLRTDGGIAWLRELAEFQAGPDGRPGRLIGTIQDITEQKVIEIALRDSEVRMRAFMDNAPVAMFVKDLDGRFTMLNQHCAVFLGHPPASAIGCRSADLLPADDAAQVESHDRAMLAAGEPVERELHFASESPIEWSYEVKFPIRDAAGAVVAIGGVARDITTQKRMEQALRHSEELLREVVFVSNIGIFEHDHRTDTINWSREQRKTYGFDADEPVTLSKYVVCVHPDDREWIFAAVQRAHDPTGDGRFDVEHRILRRDGAVRWVDTRSQTFFAGEGEARRPARTIGAVIDITDRKNAELALKESEARLRRAQLQANLACWSWDLRAGSYFWAPGSGLALGFLDAELPRDLAGYSAIVHPEDRDALRRLYAEVEADRDSYKFEYRILRPDGDVAWVEEIGEVERDAGGRRLSVSGTLQDVSERKRAEAALRVSEARLRAFMDHAPVAMFEKDLDGRFTMLNRHDAAFFGLPPEEIIGRRSADLLASDDAAIVEGHDRVVLAGGAPVERELHFVNRPRIEWSYEVKFPIMDAAGKVVSLGGVAVDISALKRTEQALRDSEARMRAFMDHAPMLIYLKDVDGRYQLVNREFEQVEGVREDQLRGKTVFDVLPPEYAAPFAASDREVLTLGRMVVHENHDPVRTLYRDSLAVKFPVRDSHGTIVGIGGFTQDITERKRAETALRESEARLRRAQLQAKLASWSWSLETDTYVWAPGSGLALGLSDADLPLANAAYSALVHPDDRDALWRLYSEVEAGRDTFTTEFRIRRPDGEVVWVEEIGEVERDALGRRLSVNGTLQDVSERKRAEAALRDSEARLRGFLDHAPFAMYLKDTDLRYLLVNRAVEQFQEGMTAAEICGRTPDQIYPLRLAERFIAEDREVLAHGAPLTFEYNDPAMTAYADSLTVRFPVRDSSGRIVAIGGITQDISERKQAERALQESEARLRDAQRRAKLAYWSWDPVTRAYVFGEEYTDIIGVESVQDIQTDDQYLCFVHEADRDWVAAGLQRQRDCLEPGVLEYRVRRPDGRIVWLRDSCEQELDAAGRVVRLAGTVQDVTDQKTTELALRESEARLADAQRRAKLAYWTWIGAGHRLTWHSDAAAVLGVPLQAMPTTSDDYVRQFVHDADRARIAALYDSATDRLSPYEAEYRIVKPDGTVAWVREIGEPTAGGDSAANYVGTIQDVTEQKQAELALRDSEARLRSFLDNAPFTIYLRDTQHRYLMVNREIERFTGKAAAEICGKTPADIYPPERAREYVENDLAVLRAGAPITVESTYPSAASYAESVTVRFPVRDSSGRIVAIGGITQDVTERKQAERALRASEARLRSFMENAPVAVAIKDLERRFVLINNKIELAFGRPASEIIGRRSVELSDSDGARAVDILEREVVATGKVATAEIYFPERKALPWTFEVKFPIRDASGALVAIGAVAVDITDRKRAELALAESEARFRSFMDNAPFDMVVKDLDGRYLMVNRGVERAWGVDAAEILGHRLPELSHSDGVAQVKAIEREVADTGRVVAREVHFTDLGPEWTYEVKFPIRDPGGGVVALGGVALDITDRKKAQMALAASEARLRRAQQQARLAYWSWQFATASTPEEYRWSPGSGELLGMPDADMPRNDPEAMSVTHPEDRERLRRVYNEVRAGLDHYAIEYRARRRDGGLVWVREVAEVVRDAEGRRIAVEGTMQDITEQRALEEQLRQAQKMESIGQLTGGIAHDFNNLMAVILGNLELLAEDLVGDRAALQKIETAIRSTLRGSDLTQRLLAFARQQSLAPKLTQIGELIRSMRDLLLRPIGPAIEVSFALADDLWSAEIDQARLETSLLNLVINARDAMPDGGRLAIAADNVTIEPGDGRESEGLRLGAYVRIAVADSGEGMTEEVRARAFDPFFTTKGIGKGTGLGLSMVYGFVKQSGGHVELVSEVGRGTTVTIYLPAAGAAAGTVLRPVDPARAVREAPQHRGGP